MFRKVLIPLDGSELADKVLGPVDRILRDQTVGVVDLLQVVPPEDGAEARSVAEEHMKGVRKQLSANSIPASITVEEGDPAEKILAHVREHQPDLVAMATHGRSGVQRWLRGSVAERVLRHCSVPLLLCNPTSLGPDAPQNPFGKILVPLDGSELAAGILALVGAVARIYDSEVVLLRIASFAVADEKQMRLRNEDDIIATLQPLAEQLAAVGIEKVSLRASFGAPAVQILDQADREDVDLVALSTHGRSGLSRWWFGSVAEAVLRHCRCPVLVRRIAP